METTICIGCGCSDHHACVDPKSGLPCSWLAVDRSIALGVCSRCPDQIERWEAGDRSQMMIVAKITGDRLAASYYIERNDMGSFPYFVGDCVGSRYAIEWVRMTVPEFEALPQFAHITLAAKWKHEVESAIKAEQADSAEEARTHRTNADRIAKEVGATGHDLNFLVEEIL